ncbi:MAG: hypothetical protein ABIU96_14680 [Rhodanobacter sp.]
MITEAGTQALFVSSAAGAGDGRFRFTGIATDTTDHVWNTPPGEKAARCAIIDQHDCFNIALVADEVSQIFASAPCAACNTSESLDAASRNTP